MKRELSQNSLKSLDSVDGRASTPSVVDNSEETAEAKPEIKSEVSQESVVETQETEAVQEKEVDSTVDKMAANDEETIDDGYFHFEMKDEFIVRNRQGKKLFICDICSGLYKHSFSLKRHYIKHHINHKYVSDADLQSCTVTKVTVISNETSPDRSTDQKCSESTAQETESKEGVAGDQDQIPVTEQCSNSMETGEIKNKGSNSKSDDPAANEDESTTDQSSNSVNKAEQVINDSASKSSSVVENNSEKGNADNSQDMDSSSEQTETSTETKASDNENSPCSTTVKSSQLAEAKDSDNATETMQIITESPENSADNHSKSTGDETSDDNPQTTKDSKASNLAINEIGDHEQKGVTKVSEEGTPGNMQANEGKIQCEPDKSRSVSENKNSINIEAKDCDSKTNDTQVSVDPSKNESSATGDDTDVVKEEISTVKETNDDAMPAVLMPGLYRCHTCSATFDSPPLLREHIKEHPSESSTDGRKASIQHQSTNAKKGIT